MNRICFSTFNLLHDVPNVCGVCTSKVPIFRFEFLDDGENTRAEYMKGFCCAPCAVKLLEVLEYIESQEWERERSALKADDMDTTDVRKQGFQLKNAQPLDSLT